jgi:hypothetical protein
LNGRTELDESPGDFFVGEGDVGGMGDFGLHGGCWYIPMRRCVATSLFAVKVAEIAEGNARSVVEGDE